MSTLWRLHNPIIYTGEVAIHPSGMTYVCNGGQVELTCTTTGPFLEWSFNLIQENATTARRFSRLIEGTSQDMLITNLSVNSTLFTFSRTSSPNSLPLTSRLLVSSVSEGLNGTVMNCDVKTDFHLMCHQLSSM